MSFEEFFFQINELNLDDLDWFSTFSPFEVDNEQTVSKLSDH